MAVGELVVPGMEPEVIFQNAAGLIEGWIEVRGGFFGTGGEGGSGGRVWGRLF